MALLRAEAREALAARRGDAALEPARVAAPLTTTAVVAVVAATFLAVLGATWPVIVGAIILVALLGAVVARRVTANLVAGAGLAAVRPYVPGEHVRLWSPAAGRVVEAELVRTGALNTTLATEDGLLVVPNTLLFRPAPH